MSRSYHTSKPNDGWTKPRSPYNDANRLRTHGNIQPMRRPGLFARLFGKD